LCKNCKRWPIRKLQSCMDVGISSCSLLSSSVPLVLFLFFVLCLLISSSRPCLARRVQGTTKSTSA
jgi:hypothetical protein